MTDKLALKKKIKYQWVLKGLMLLSIGIVSALIIFMFIYVFAKGIPHITWKFLSTKPS